MCACRPRSNVVEGLSPGFSLVEMLVALVFLSALMAGMLRVFASSTSAFMAGNETIAVQRNTRWGINLLQEQVLEAGFLFPIRSAPGGLMAGPMFQPPLLLQTTGYKPDGVTAVDELQMVMDIPLNVQGTSVNPIAVGATSFAANIPTGASSIQAGDLVLIEDTAAEFPTISMTPGSGTNAILQLKSTEAAGIDPITGTPYNTMSPTGGFKNPHLVGMPFTVIRPSQVVRFTVVPRPMDPSDSSVMVPCLVRQSTTLAPGTIWSPDLNTPAANEQVLLENVVGFSVDWSLDGGRTWLKDAVVGGTWTDIRNALNTAITTHESTFVRQSGGVNNPAIPMWTLYTPMLIRIDLSTRSTMQRVEFSPDGSADNPLAAYRIRRETLMISPRNFGIGLH